MIVSNEGVKELAVIEIMGYAGAEGVLVYRIRKVTIEFYFLT